MVNLIEHYRNLMIAKAAVSNQEKLLDLPRELCQLIAHQAKEISLENIFLGFTTLLGAQEAARYMDNLRIPLEIALVKLSSQGKDYGALKSASGVPEKRDIPLNPPRDKQNITHNPYLRAPAHSSAAPKPKEVQEHKPPHIHQEHNRQDDVELDLERVKDYGRSLWSV